MKKSITIFLSVLMILTIVLTGCSGDKSTLSGDATSKSANSSTASTSSSASNQTSDAVSTVKNIELVDVEVNGLSFKIPDDFNDFTETQGIMIAKNADSTASIAVSDTFDVQGRTPYDIDQEYYKETVLPANDEVNFITFEEALVGYVPAIFTHFTTTNSSGLEVEAYAFFINIPVDDGDDLAQNIMFSFTKDSENSITKNIDAIKESISVIFE